MYIPRALEKVVMEISGAFPVLMVTGPRQVGKTTLLEKLSEKERTYVTLDDPIVRQTAKEDPSLFFQRYQPPVLIDEIQYAPELFPYIKMYVDTHKKKGDFWLTGSQMFQMMSNMSESLAGRVGIIQMLGLATAELNRMESKAFRTESEMLMKRLKSAVKMDLKSIYKRIFKGSMPALYETEQDVERYYASYVSTYIQRDIRDLTQVADEMTFLRFLTACAARTSRMVNYTELAKDVGISAPTAKQWLSLLVSSGVLCLIEPYFNNALKRIIKSPNMYFLDTGLCAYLTRWTTSEALEVSAMSGQFFETYVVSEIIKSYYNSGKRPPLFYYRDSDGKEIDLILEENNVLYPIEIKKAANPKSGSYGHFKVLEKTGKNVGTGNVVCMIDDLVPFKKNVWAVPAWLI